MFSHTKTTRPVDYTTGLVDTHFNRITRSKPCNLDHQVNN